MGKAKREAQNKYWPEGYPALFVGKNNNKTWKKKKDDRSHKDGLGLGLGLPLPPLQDSSPSGSLLPKL